VSVISPQLFVPSEQAAFLKSRRLSAAFVVEKRLKKFFTLVKRPPLCEPIASCFLVPTMTPCVFDF
jgi:hypothetical protein